MKSSEQNSKPVLQPSGDFPKLGRENKLANNEKLTKGRRKKERDFLEILDKYKLPGALYYGLDSPVKSIKPAAGPYFQIEELQNYVGGLVEIIRLHREGLPDKLIILNEEGKLIGLSVNLLATGVWMQYYRKAEIIVGNAIICDPSFIEI